MVNELPSIKSLNYKPSPRRLQGTPLEGCYAITLTIYIAVMYFTSRYFLNTPIEDWLFNIGQYNSQLLELFPKAQYWVNASVAYRENIIPVYVLYQIFIYLFAITSIALLIKQQRYNIKRSIYIYNNPSILSTKYFFLYVDFILSNKYFSYVYITFFFFVSCLLVFVFFTMLEGLQYYTYQDDDLNSLFNNSNQLIGMVCLLYVLIVSVAHIFISLFNTTIIFFKKIKKNNRRRVKT